MPTMPKEYSRSKQREHRAKQSLLKGGLLPFQKRFVDALTRKQGAPEIGILCSPRAQGKSWLCGRLIGRSLTPGDDLHESSVENVLVASSRSQAAITLEFARQALADVPGIRWSNDGAIHVASRARIKIISSDARRSLGLGAHSRMLFCDEPSAWSPQAGRRLFDSMRTALGKRKCQIVLCGTIAPAPSSGAGSWWPDLVMAGSGKGVHVELVQGRFDSWKDWAEVLKANPACAVNPYLEKTLRREFEEALKSERAAIPFRQYRLNLPGGESTGEQPLITLAEWQRVCARPVPACEGNPVIGIDLAGRDRGRQRVPCGLREEFLHGRLRRVNRVWPIRNARIKYQRTRIRRWSGLAAWRWTRGAPSLTSRCCWRGSGRGRLRASSATPFAPRSCIRSSPVAPGLSSGRAAVGNPRATSRVSAACYSTPPPG